MEKSFWKRAVWETVRAALVYTVFCLLAMALAAVFIKAYAPAQGVVIGVSWAIRCIGAFLACLLFGGRGRALFKGMAAGFAGEIFTLFAFAAIGGGFSVTAFFPLQLLAAALMGGAGALVGGKLRKE